MLKLILVLLSAVFFAHMSETASAQKAEHQLKTAGGIPEKSTDKIRRMDFWCFSAVLVLAFFAALRTGYNDTISYKRHFRAAETVAELIASDELEFAGNPLYYLFQSFIRQLTDNYHVFFLIIAFISFYCFVKFIKKHSKSFSYSTYLFIAMGTYIFTITAMKQALAMAVLTIAVDKLLQKKYVSFYLFVLIASGFHLYALIFAVLPFFLSKPWNARTYILLAAMLIVMLTFESTLTSFMEVADDMGKNVAEEEVFDGNSMNIFRVLVYAVLPILTFAGRKRIFEDTDTSENLFVNMGIISFCAITLGLISAPNMFARVATYFELGTAIAIPTVIDKSFQPETAKSVKAGAAICYFLYFLYEYGIAKSFSTAYTSITFFEFLKELM